MSPVVVAAANTHNLFLKAHISNSYSTRILSKLLCELVVYTDSPDEQQSERARAFLINVVAFIQRNSNRSVTPRPPAIVIDFWHQYAGAPLPYELPCLRRYGTVLLVWTEVLQLVGTAAGLISSRVSALARVDAERSDQQETSIECLDLHDVIYRALLPRLQHYNSTVSAIFGGKVVPIAIPPSTPSFVGVPSTEADPFTAVLEKSRELFQVPQLAE